MLRGLSWRLRLPFHLRSGRTIVRGPYWRAVLPFRRSQTVRQRLMTPVTVRVPVKWIVAGLLLIVLAALAGAALASSEERFGAGGKVASATQRFPPGR